MHPLDIDHIVERVLSFVHDTGNLLSCRAVNRTWHSVTGSRLADRGEDLRLGLDHRTIWDYYTSVVEGRWTLSPLTQDLNIYVTGDQAQNNATVKFASALASDPTLDPARRIKLIRFESRNAVDDKRFWKLVQIAAPHLEELYIKGGFLRTMGPGTPNSTIWLRILLPDSEEAWVTRTEFPSLTTAYYDMRRQMCDEDVPVPFNFIETINAAPNLHTLRLIRADGEATTANLTLGDCYLLPKLRRGAAERISELEMAIYQNDEQSLDDGSQMCHDLTVGMLVSGLDHLKCLKIHQHFSYIFTERFLSTMIELPALSSLEYYFMRRSDSTTEDLDIMLPEGPAQLPNIAHFGVYFQECVVNVDKYPYTPTRATWDNENRNPSISDLVKLREDEFIRSAYPRNDKPPMENMANCALRVMKNMHLISRLCPNIRSLSTDATTCMVLTSLAKAPAADGRFLIPFYNGVIVNDVRTEFQGVDALTVKTPFTRSENAACLTPEFAARVTQAWSALCPLLNKLVLDVQLGQANPAVTNAAIHQSKFVVSVSGILPALVNLNGVTHLEINNYWENWLGELLIKDPASVAELRENLTELSLHSTARKITRQNPWGAGGNGSDGQSFRMNGKLGSLPGLIDSFQQLQSITVEPEAWDLAGVAGAGRTYKTTHISFVRENDNNE